MYTIEDLQARADIICARYEIEPVRVVRLVDQAPRRFLLGQASYWTRELRVSYERPNPYGLREQRPDEELLETLYHELAHFVAFKHGDMKHGPIWKKYARTLGAYARAHVGNIAAEEAREKKRANDKTQRAKNRKAHPSHTMPDPHCHLCLRETWKRT